MDSVTCPVGPETSGTTGAKDEEDYAVILLREPELGILLLRLFTDA